jgi:hypothetical protein
VLLEFDPMAQIQKANDGKIKGDLSQLQKILESYYADTGHYPASSSDYKFRPVADQGTDIGVDWGQPWTPYIDFLPKGPASGNYAYVSDGQSYYLYANLQRAKYDPKACTNEDGGKCSNAPDGACGSVPCNYGVTSPNVNP